VRDEKNRPIPVHCWYRTGSQVPSSVQSFYCTSQARNYSFTLHGLPWDMRSISGIRSRPGFEREPARTHDGNLEGIASYFFRHEHLMLGLPCTVWYAWKANYYRASEPSYCRFHLLYVENRIQICFLPLPLLYCLILEPRSSDPLSQARD
jgi:hypothetical protein